MSKTSLHQLASARSGEGNHANIGVVARDAAAYKLLARELTSERVGEFFAGLGATKVERFELPNVLAFNFLLYDALAGGASQSLRSDTQGKLLGTAMLEMTLPLRREDLTAEGAEGAEEDWKE